MKIRDIRQAVANRIAPTHDNAMAGGAQLARDFLRYGPMRTVSGDWAQTLMTDRDKYSGYMYGAIDRRVTKVNWLAEYNLKTHANKPTADKAKAAGIELRHPYLDIIDESPSFTNNEFWEEIQTYLDLRGEYFLLAVRGKLGEKVGDIKEFKLLSPYDVSVVYDADNMNVIGYVETREGQFREIPPHMIIRIRKFNPFSRKDPYSMAMAAQDAQFTIKEATENMRTAVRRNRRFPGVALLGNGGVSLDAKQAENFKSRMHEKAGQDEPLIYGAGATGKGTIAWNDMQVDLRKSQVDMVNEVQLNNLIAVTGASKTKLSIEQSGVTRDTAEVQDDLFTADQGMPALQRIVGALNQDYKTMYPDQYKSTGYRLYIDSPLNDDKDGELTDVKIRTQTFELYTTLVDSGYDPQTAADFAAGKKDLSEIGKPATPKPATVPPANKTDEQNRIARRVVLAEERALTGVRFNQIAARDYPDIYADLDIDFDELGCIMLDLAPVDVTKYVTDGADDLLPPTSDGQHQRGAVAEREAHVTLLFGLLENGNTWKDKVDRLLDGWEPGTVKVDHVDYFELPDSYAVVAHIQKTAEIVDGHERLTLLPHINTFSEYTPHMTLAYIKKDADVSAWVSALAKQYDGAILKPLGINYGDPEDGGDDNSAASQGHQPLPVIRNDIQPKLQATVTQQESALKNHIISVQHQVVAAVLNKVERNDFKTQDDIIDDGARADAAAKLEEALSTFYEIIIPINASSTISRRAQEFGLLGTFRSDEEVTRYVKLTATRAADSHLNTVLEDILETVHTTEERLVQDELKRITPKPGQSPEEVLQLARKKALEGVGRQQIAAAIRQEYSDTISKTRATTIARTETNRAFNRGQFEADRQFIEQNDLKGKAYKKWVTRSDNPCPYCLAKAAEPPIPFAEPFARVGDILQATFEKSDGTPSLRQMEVGFEDCLAGEIHPNGHCTYQLIIQ